MRWRQGVGKEEEKIERGVVGVEEKVLTPCQQCGKIFFSMVGLNIHKSKYCKEEEKMGGGDGAESGFRP